MAPLVNRKATGLLTALRAAANRAIAIEQRTIVSLPKGNRENIADPEVRNQPSYRCPEPAEVGSWD